MVSSARDREIDEVKATLLEIAKKYGDTTEYQKLRSQIPEEFPF